MGTEEFEKLGRANKPPGQPLLCFVYACRDAHRLLLASCLHTRPAAIIDAFDERITGHSPPGIGVVARAAASRREADRGGLAINALRIVIGTVPAHLRPISSDATPPTFVHQLRFGILDNPHLIVSSAVGYASRLIMSAVVAGAESIATRAADRLRRVPAIRAIQSTLIKRTGILGALYPIRIEGVAGAVGGAQNRIAARLRRVRANRAIQSTLQKVLFSLTQMFLAYIRMVIFSHL